jgi:hypothetical protein
VAVLPNGTSAGTSNVKSLTIAGGATPTATLDLADNAMVVDYTGPSPLATIKAQVRHAYDGGTWAEHGITSSQADASQFGVGYAEASALGGVPTIFGTVDADAVLLRRTRYGDANLDGQVNLQDFNRLASGFGAGDDWSEGDFNYDGLVNLQDFNRLAANFGQSPRTFSQGDFNYDTVVNLSDFNLLAGRFGQVLSIASPGEDSTTGTTHRDDDDDRQLDGLS